jgi:hypothetical protein
MILTFVFMKLTNLLLTWVPLTTTLYRGTDPRILNLDIRCT